MRRIRSSPASSSIGCGTITSASAWSTRRATSASTAAGRRIPSCSTGSPPSWCAANWSLKDMHRLIVTSRDLSAGVALRRRRPPRSTPAIACCGARARCGSKPRRCATPSCTSPASSTRRWAAPATRTSSSTIRGATHYYTPIDERSARIPSPQPLPHLGPQRPQRAARHPRLPRSLDDHAPPRRDDDAVAGAGAFEQRLRAAHGGSLRRATTKRSGRRMSTSRWRWPTAWPSDARLTEDESTSRLRRGAAPRPQRAVPGDVQQQ